MINKWSLTGQQKMDQSLRGLAHIFFTMYFSRRLVIKKPLISYIPPSYDLQIPILLMPLPSSNIAFLLTITGKDIYISYRPPPCKRLWYGYRRAGIELASYSISGKRREEITPNLKAHLAGKIKEVLAHSFLAPRH